MESLLAQPEKLEWPVWRPYELQSILPQNMSGHGFLIRGYTWELTIPNKADLDRSSYTITKLPRSLLRPIIQDMLIFA